MGWRQYTRQPDYYKTIEHFEHEIWKSERRVRSKTVSRVVDVIERYSVSAEEQETVGCFLDFQETKESPRKTQYLFIDRWLSGQEAQSESTKALIVKELLAENKRTWGKYSSHIVECGKLLSNEDV